MNINWIKKMWWLTIILMCLAFFQAVSLSEAQNVPELKAVAKLDSFQGEISLKHKGLWTKPEQGMILYHGDKVLSGNGTCKIIFNDGAVLNVLQNSSIRIAEFVEEVTAKTKGSFSSTKNETREIRVFIGKVGYQSGTGKLIETKMIAPTAVAALRGTDVEFGTNGDTAFIQHKSGSSSKQGNISEGSVPEITKTQAINNKEYAASAEADRLRQEYLNAVKALLESLNFNKDLYLASTDNILNLLIIAQTTQTMKMRADHVLQLAAQYSFADTTALIIENESLLQNPDPIVRNRAVLALEKCKVALQQAQLAIKNARDISTKVDAFIQRITNAKSEEELSAIKKEFQDTLNEMKRIQTEYNQQALGKALVANEFTIGIDQNRFIEDFENKISKTAVDLIKDSDYDSITVDILIETGKGIPPTISIIPSKGSRERGIPKEDRDGDGFTEARGDCDDNDPNRSPGLLEKCNDKIDNNCNGLIDEQPCYYGQ